MPDANAVGGFNDFVPSSSARCTRLLLPAFTGTKGHLGNDAQDAQERPQLVAMEPSDTTHHSLAEGSEQHPDLTAIYLIRGPRHQPGPLAPRHQCNHAVRDHVQSPCKLAQERPVFRLALDLQQQLVLKPSDSFGLGRLIAEAQELPQLEAEFRKRGVVGLFQALRTGHLQLGTPGSIGMTPNIYHLVMLAHDDC